MQLFSPIQYLKIDIANSFGLDKKKWNERLAWFDKNEANLEELYKQADEPALFYAGVLAYRRVQKGLPNSHPISLDATSSGLQILAALTSDRKAAEICNVVNMNGDNEDPERANAYTILYDRMLEELAEGEELAVPDKDQVGIKIVNTQTGVAAPMKIDPKKTKQAIMTAFYGSKAMPKTIFGNGPLLALFYNTLEKSCPAAWDLNETFVSIWDPKALSNEWVLPDNFHVKVKVMDRVVENVRFLNTPYEFARMVNAPTEKGLSLAANSTHSIDGMIVREVSRRCNYDPAVVDRVKAALSDRGSMIPSGKGKDDQMVLTLWKHYQDSGYLSARILDYLDDYNIGLVDGNVIRELIDSLPAKPFEVISIHDCFRCLPNYGNDLRKQYNLQLHLIARSNLLSFLLSQLLHRKVSIGKLNPGMIPDILEANYALS